jgi:ubiquinone biosynthesis protein UbiJ
MTSPSMIETLLERIVRAGRNDSPRASALLEQLRGRRLALRVLGTPFNAVIESTGQSLRLVSTDSAAAGADANGSATPDATVSGAPLALLTLIRGDSQAAPTRGDVTIEGNAEIAQQFRELALLLRPDLEAGLAPLLGRSGAHILMRGLSSLRDWARASAWTATQNVAEYLAHERGDLVPRTEAEHFLRGVDEVREQVDRLTARLEQIEQRLRVNRP